MSNAATATATATVTAKGQITIPVEVRQALKLDAGARVSFEEVQPGAYLIRPAQKLPVTALKAMFGRHPKVVSVDEMNRVIAQRGARAK